MLNKLKEILQNNIFMIRRSWVLARGTWIVSFINFILSTVRPFIMLIISKFIYDELAKERKINYLIKLVVLYAAIITFFYIADLLISRFSMIRQRKINHRIEMDNKKKWLYMDYDNFENGYTRELAGRCVGQVDPQNFFSSTLLDFIKNIIQFAGYTYIIALLHPIVIMMIIAIVIINMLIEKKLNKIDYDYQPIINRISRRLSFIFDCMTDFNMGKDIRINRASSWLRKKHRIEAEEYCNEYRKNQNNTVIWKILIAVTDLVQTIIMYGYCAYLAINGSISIGDFTVFLGAISAFSGSLTELINRFPKFAIQSKYINDYKEFLSLTVHVGMEKEIVSGKDPTNGKYDIEFVDVSFKYPNTDIFVLRHVNLKIKSGERLSIVGYNGAGKSTMIKLICRLYEPTEGQILVGGINISTIKLHDYRELLSVVFQDYILYWLTIKDNIVLNREYDPEKLNLAIEHSGLKERISLLESGVNTELESLFDYDRMEFSGGEGQKLACARAYYKNAPIVILDEPTASLDPFAENMLYDNFNNNIGKKNSIYISHRLASVRFCDSVAVFVDGELVERGSHLELMAKHGVYAEMFSKQAHYYVSDDPVSKEISI